MLGAGSTAAIQLCGIVWRSPKAVFVSLFAAAKVHMIENTVHNCVPAACARVAGQHAKKAGFKVEAPFKPAAVQKMR